MVELGYIPLKQRDTVKTILLYEEWNKMLLVCDLMDDDDELVVVSIPGK